MADTETIHDENKVELLGNLVQKVDSVLSPKPISIWHVPGALSRILSPLILIFNHGLKGDSEESFKLWNFVFGLRVLRPDLWPVLELKQYDTVVSKQKLFALWLQVSLQSALLKEQLKTLLEDRDRLMLYYYDWAFLRAEKYTEALLIILEALDLNSQSLLATVNPSLMVSYYRKERKDYTFSNFLQKSRNEHKDYITHEENVEWSVGRDNTSTFPTATVNSAISNSFGNEYDSSDLLSSFVPSRSVSENQAVQEMFNNAWQVSPRCLQVNYGSSLLSDGDKNGNEYEGNKMDKKLGQCTTSESYNCGAMRAFKKAKHRKRNNKNTTDVKDMVTQAYFTTSSSSSDPKELVLETQVDKYFSDIVQPSGFLLQYLASKPVFRERQNRSSLTSADCADQVVSTIDSEMDAAKLQHRTERQAHDSKKFSNSLSAQITKNSSLPHCATANAPPLFSKMQEEGYNSYSQVENKYHFHKQQKQVSKHNRSHSDGSAIILSDSAPTPLSLQNLSMAGVSSSENFLEARKTFVKKRFMEDGGHSITPEADGFFPYPQPGQNLLDFLSSSQFSKTSAQLDKENAHFNIAEAVLAAIEQMNYDSIYLREESAPVNPSNPDESEDDFLNNRRNIPNRRRPRLRSRVAVVISTSDDEPVTTDYSIRDSPQSSEESSDFGCLTDSHIKSERAIVDNDSSDNQSMQTNDPCSAENVAIAILKHYNTKLLPQANELQWLVTEQDAPQKLLPMPNSIAVSPDDADQSCFTTLLRGTTDWAPPRPQLILTLHSNTRRTSCLISQKWRCAGCGLRVSERLSRHFRLCHYLGRYFCTSCHSNKRALIPAKILHTWDFKKYYVCNFSSELLCRMSSDPLFNVGTLNPGLYRQSRDLHQTHLYRLQLYHARVYINICSRAKKEKLLLRRVPLHWSTEPHLYSVDDLIAVKTGQMVSSIRHHTTSCINHISNCKVCLGQGFICEICGQGNPIFPFQLDAVSQCTKCRACFHFLCFSPVSSCPRCKRRERREKEEKL